MSERRGVCCPESRKVARHIQNGHSACDGGVSSVSSPVTWPPGAAVEVQTKWGLRRRHISSPEGSGPGKKDTCPRGALGAHWAGLLRPPGWLGGPNPALRSQFLRGQGVRVYRAGWLCLLLPPVLSACESPSCFSD